MSAVGLYSKAKGRDLKPAEVAAIEKELLRLEAKERALTARESALVAREEVVVKEETRLAAWESSFETRQRGEVNAAEAGQEYQPALRDRSRPKPAGVLEAVALQAVGDAPPVLGSGGQEGRAAAEAAHRRSEFLQSELQRAQKTTNEIAHRAAEALERETLAIHACEELQQQLGAKCAALNERVAACATADARLVDQTKEMAMLYAGAQKTHVALEAAQQQLRERDKALEEARGEKVRVAELSAALLTAEAAVADLEDRLRSSQAALAEAHVHCDCLRGQCTALETDAARWRKEAEAANDSLRDELAAARAQQDAQFATLQRREAEGEAHAAQVRNLRKEMQGQQDAHQAELQRVKFDLKAQAHKVQRAREEAECTKVCNTCATHLVCIAKLELELKTLREKLKAMEKYVEEVEVRTAVMQAEWLEAHDAEMIALRHHVDYLATMIKYDARTELEANMAKVRWIAQVALEEINKLRLMVSQEKALVQAREPPVDKLLANEPSFQELRSLRSGLADALMVAKTTKTQLMATEHKAKELEIKTKTLKRVEATTREDVARTDRRCRMAEEQNAHLKEQLQQLEETVEAAHADIKRRNDETRMLRIETQSYKEEVRGLRRKLRGIASNEGGEDVLDKHTDELEVPVLKDQTTAQRQLIVMKETIRSLKEDAKRHERIEKNLRKRLTSAIMSSAAAAVANSSVASKPCPEHRMSARNAAHTLGR